MLRSQFGVEYVPPAIPAPPTFELDDWTDWEWAEKWAEGMWEEELSAGCSADPLRFCPLRELPREEASVFGLRIKYGSDYTPPEGTGMVFADVGTDYDLTDPNYWGTKWVEQAYWDQLLPACGTDEETEKPLFCPKDAVDRAWAAYLIVQAKGIPIIEYP
jgi:hypothetical protein